MDGCQKYILWHSFDVGISIPSRSASFSEGTFFDVDKGGIDIGVRFTASAGMKPQVIKDISAELWTPSGQMVDRIKIVENLTIPESLHLSLFRKIIDEEEGIIIFVWRVDNSSSVIQAITPKAHCPFSTLEIMVKVGDNIITPNEKVFVGANESIHPVAEVIPIGTVIEPSCSLKFKRKK